MPLTPSMHQALQRLRPGAEPQASILLGDERASRRCVWVHYRDADWVLKEARPGAAGWAQAQHEFAATRWAHRHGLAPAPVDLDVDHGLLVLHYLPGATPWSDCQALGTWLRQLHDLPVPPTWPRFDPVAAAAASLLDMERAGIVESAPQGWLQVRLAAARAQLKSLPAVPPAPCHNDLQPLNLVRGSGAPHLIDWEEAAAGDPLWDLASWIVSLELPAAEQAAMLQAHGGDAQRLQALCSVAQVYFTAWGLLRPAWRALERERLQRFMA